MDYLALIEEIGLRVLNGQRRLQVALSLGKDVLACDTNGMVYRFAIEGNSLVVECLVDHSAEPSMLIVERI